MLKFIERMFSKLKNAIENASVCTSPVVDDFMLLPKQIGYMEYGPNPNCVVSAMSLLILIYCCQVLRRSSRTDGDKYVYSSAKASVRSKEESQMREHLILRRAAKAYPSIEKFMRNFPCQLRTYFTEGQWPDIARSVPGNKKSGDKWAWQDIYEVDAVLSVSCRAASTFSKSHGYVIVLPE